MVEASCFVLKIYSVGADNGSLSSRKRTITQSRQIPSRLPRTRSVQISEKPSRLTSARFAAFSGKTRLVSLLDRLQFWSCLTRLPSDCGFWNFDELSRFHVVDVAVNRNVIGNQRVISNTGDILGNAFSVV